MYKKFIFLLVLILISGCTTGNQEPILEGPFKVTNVVDGDKHLSKV